MRCIQRWESDTEGGDRNVIWFTFKSKSLDVHSEVEVFIFMTSSLILPAPKVNHYLTFSYEDHMMCDERDSEKYHTGKPPADKI